jgi:phenylalanine-4-hydroxylase
MTDVMHGHDHLVVLDAEHPGFHDRAYRLRRDTIARQSMAWRPGDAVPDVPYTDDEHEVWRSILAALVPVHAARAGRAYFEACERLQVRRDRIPQLGEVNGQLAPLGGYRLIPAGGLVDAREFLLKLAEREFTSTQYIRHASRPFYTPEPDVVHELVGHAATLAHPTFIHLNGLFGRATRKTPADDIEANLQLIRLYWWTVEFGVHMEDGTLRTCGAGLLSSVGECGAIASGPQLRPFTPEEAVQTPFEPTAYQGSLFVGDSFAAMANATADWLEQRIRSL